MNTISIRKAAIRLDVNEKTIRRWIADGKLPAQLVNGQYQIKIEDLDNMSRPVNTSQRLDVLENKIESLTSLVLSMDIRLKEIEQRPTELPEYKEPKLSTVDNLPEPPKSTTVKPVRSTIPEGCIILRHFNELHNMKHTTVGRRVEAGTIQVTRGEWQYNRQRVTQVLTPEQQHIYWQQLHSESGFESCEQCPH